MITFMFVVMHKFWKLVVTIDAYREDK